MVAGNNYIYQREGKIHFFCPICKDHKSTKLDRVMGWKHHVCFAIATVAITVACWDWFGLKAIYFYLPIWTGFELMHRLRKRVALVCDRCGFDPFIYKTDVKKAREAMRKHWENKIEKENWYAGVKLKNYKTNSKPDAVLDSDRPNP